MSEHPLAVTGLRSHVAVHIDDEVGFRAGIVGPGDTPYLEINPLYASGAQASFAGVTLYLSASAEANVKFLKGLQHILNDLAVEVERAARDEQVDYTLVLYADSDDPEIRALRHAGITTADGHADGTD